MTPVSLPHVAILGTGTMGAAMARTLLREGFRVTVWNRTAERARPLAASGTAVATAARDAAADADVILSVLFDGAAVEGIFDEVAPAVRDGAVWAQCSTIGVEATERLRQRHAGSGFALVEAMMLGTKGPAEQGELVMLTAGESAALARLAPVLAAVGQKTVFAGPRVGDATSLKLAANAWIATITAGTAQSLALAGALGIAPELFLEAIAGGQSDSVYAHVKGAAMLAGEYPPSFALDGLLKDIRLASAQAAEHGVATDLFAGLDALYSRVSTSGHGDEDIAAVRRAF